MVALVAIDIVEIAVLPRTGVDVEPYVDGIALVNVELRNPVSAEYAEKASTWILVLGLYDKLL